MLVKTWSLQKRFLFLYVGLKLKSSFQVNPNIEVRKKPIILFGFELDLKKKLEKK